MVKKSELKGLQYAQRERLAFIDYCLQYIGKVSRTSIVNHFDVGLASCSRDLKLYHSLTESNTVFHHSDKSYYRSDSFQPLFEHDPNAVLASLLRGFGDGLSIPTTDNKWVFDAQCLMCPPSETVGALTRAIFAGVKVNVIYHSISSGKGSRVIAPHAIINNGHRWHVRGFDYHTKEYRDFVCTRIESIQVTEELADSSHLQSEDDQWQKSVTLKLVPHPNLLHTKPIEMDFTMVNGELEIQTNAALAGYLLRYWNVDCTKDAILNEKAHNLWLKDQNILNEIANKTICPGYEP